MSGYYTMFWEVDQGVANALSQATGVLSVLGAPGPSRPYDWATASTDVAPDARWGGEARTLPVPNVANGTIEYGTIASLDLFVIVGDSWVFESYRVWGSIDFKQIIVDLYTAIGANRAAGFVDTTLWPVFEYLTNVETLPEASVEDVLLFALGDTHLAGLTEPTRTWASGNPAGGGTFLGDELLSLTP